MSFGSRIRELLHLSFYFYDCTLELGHWDWVVHRIIVLRECSTARCRLHLAVSIAAVTRLVRPCPSPWYGVGGRRHPSTVPALARHTASPASLPHPPYLPAWHPTPTQPNPFYLIHECNPHTQGCAVLRPALADALGHVHCGGVRPRAGVRGARRRKGWEEREGRGLGCGCGGGISIVGSSKAYPPAPACIYARHLSRECLCCQAPPGLPP